MKLFLVLFLLLSPTYLLATGTHDHDHEQESIDNHHGFEFGQAGSVDDVDKTVEIIMTDNQYDLPSLDVSVGETILFKIKNEGRQIHEFTIATTNMHAQHQNEMLNHINSGHMSMTNKGSAMGHDHENSLLLNPDESGEIIWTFALADNLEYACNVPGHYQSGMVGSITIDQTIR